MALTQVKTSGIADDAVTLAKQAGGTDGQVITFDASGNPVAVGPGTDGQVLTSTGAGSPPAFEDAAGGPTLSGSTNNNVVTVTGANAMIGEANVHISGNQLLIGHGTSCTDGGDLQVHGVGDARVMDLISNRADVEGPRLRFSKSRVASGGDYTVVQDDDYLGKIEFAGADGTDYNALGAIIQVRVDGTPGSNDMPGRMEFHTTADGNPNPIERMTIDSTGNVTVKDGDLIIGTSGHGISFAATAAPNAGSGTSEILKDYEEGTWTPAVRFSSGGTTGITYNSQIGVYTKIGRLIVARGEINLSSKGSDTGYFAITGFPYNEGNYGGNLAVAGSSQGWYYNMANWEKWFTLDMFSNDDVAIWRGGNTGNSNNDRNNSDVNDNSNISFVVNYFTDE